MGLELLRRGSVQQAQYQKGNVSLQGNSMCTVANPERSPAAHLHFSKSVPTHRPGSMRNSEKKDTERNLGENNCDPLFTWSTHYVCMEQPVGYEKKKKFLQIKGRSGFGSSAPLQDWLDKYRSPCRKCKQSLVMSFFLPFLKQLIPRPPTRR